MMERILVVDDEKLIRWSLMKNLTDAGYEVLEAADGQQALELLDQEGADRMLLDVRMPKKDGLEVLAHMVEHSSEIPIILMTAFGTIDSAVEAMQAGAFDYVTKPFKRDALLVSLERAFELRALEQENRRLRRAVDRTSSFGELIGTSADMHWIRATIGQLS